MPSDGNDTQRRQQPVAPIRPVEDTYFGQSVADPYRWMEADQDPEAPV